VYYATIYRMTEASSVSHTAPK